ncbi:MAG: hypothetical protein ACYSTQ_03740, partial [Planctomycetota bacterium]
MRVKDGRRPVTTVCRTNQGLSFQGQLNQPFRDKPVRARAIASETWLDPDGTPVFKIRLTAVSTCFLP